MAEAISSVNPCCEARTDEDRVVILDLISRTEENTSVRSLQGIKGIIQSLWVQDDLADFQVVLSKLKQHSLVPGPARCQQRVELKVVAVPENRTYVPIFKLITYTDLRKLRPIRSRREILSPHLTFWGPKSFHLVKNIANPWPS
jgi:hypothetical protein